MARALVTPDPKGRPVSSSSTSPGYMLPSFPTCCPTINTEDLGLELSLTRQLLSERTMPAGPPSCFPLLSQEPGLRALGQPHTAPCPCGLVFVQKRCQPLSAHSTTSSSARSQPRGHRSSARGTGQLPLPHSLLFLVTRFRFRGTAGWSSKLNSVPNLIYRSASFLLLSQNTPKL